MSSNPSNYGEHKKMKVKQMMSILCIGVVLFGSGGDIAVDMNNVIATIE